MRKRLLHLILPVMAVILEILPYGAVCNFARPSEDGTIGYFREVYSYFDLLPFGYANFAPFLTAIATCLLIVAMLIYCVTGRGCAANAARNILCVAAALSLGPLVFGIRYYSVVGALITTCLTGELLLFQTTIRKTMIESGD